MRNRLLLATILMPPIVLTIVPLIAEQRHRGSPAARHDRPDDRGRSAPEWASLDPRELTAAFGIQQFLVFFLMLPAYIPLAIASYSIVGEKTSRSLEAVLADTDPDPRAAHRQGGRGAPARPARRLADVRGVRRPDRPAATARSCIGVVTDGSWLVGAFVLGPAIGLVSVVAGHHRQLAGQRPAGRPADRRHRHRAVWSGSPSCRPAARSSSGRRAMRSRGPHRAGRQRGRPADRRAPVRPGDDPHPLAVGTRRLCRR